MNISLRDNKEIIVFVFDNAFQRDYWFMTASVKLFTDLIYSNRRKKVISLPEADYWFVSSYQSDRLVTLKHNLCYSYKELVIILNDFERTKLETYVEDSEHDYNKFRSLL